MKNLIIIIGLTILFIIGLSPFLKIKSFTIDPLFSGFCFGAFLFSIFIIFLRNLNKKI